VHWIERSRKSRANGSSRLVSSRRFCSRRFEAGPVRWSFGFGRLDQRLSTNRTGDDELKQPTHLMEHAAPSMGRFLPFGVGAEPAMVAARIDGRGLVCFSSEERAFPSEVVPSFVSSFVRWVVPSGTIGLSNTSSSELPLGAAWKKNRSETRPSIRISILGVPRECRLKCSVVCFHKVGWRLSHEPPMALSGAGGSRPCSSGSARRCRQRGVCNQLRLGAKFLLDAAPDQVEWTRSTTCFHWSEAFHFHGSLGNHERKYRASMVVGCGWRKLFPSCGWRLYQQSMISVVHDDWHLNLADGWGHDCRLFLLLRKLEGLAFGDSAWQTVHLEEGRLFGAVLKPGRQPDWTPWASHWNRESSCRQPARTGQASFELWRIGQAACLNWMNVFGCFKRDGRQSVRFRSAHRETRKVRASSRREFERLHRGWEGMNKPSVRTGCASSDALKDRAAVRSTWNSFIEAWKGWTIRQPGSDEHLRMFWRTEQAVRSTRNCFIEAWKDHDKGLVGMGWGSSDALNVQTSSLNEPARLLEQLGVNRKAARQFRTSLLKLGRARQAIGADRKGIFGCLEGKGRWFSRYKKASWSLSRDGVQPQWTGRVSRNALKGTAGRS